MNENTKFQKTLELRLNSFVKSAHLPFRTKNAHLPSNRLIYYSIEPALLIKSRSGLIKISFWIVLKMD